MLGYLTIHLQVTKVNYFHSKHIFYPPFQTTHIFIFEMCLWESSKALRLSSDARRAKCHRAVAVPGRTVRCQKHLKKPMSNLPLGEPAHCILFANHLSSGPCIRLFQILKVETFQFCPHHSPPGVLVVCSVLCLISYWHYSAWSARECISVIPAI